MAASTCAGGISVQRLVKWSFMGATAVSQIIMLYVFTCMASNSRGTVDNEFRLDPRIFDNGNGMWKMHGNRTMLTIAVDGYGSCPAKCGFVHPNLPPWLRYRYIHFRNESELVSVDDDKSTHLLIVARTNIIKLSDYAVKRRNMTDGRFAVGLWHIADERIFKGEIIYPYPKFDFVVRNYYSEVKPFFNMTLRALGNLTCGTSDAPLPSNNPNEPRWGVHWIHLDSHILSVEMRRSAESVWPTSLRKVNCSFMGQKDTRRSRGERLLMQNAVKAIPELEYKLEFSSGFAQGHKSFRYFNDDIATAKIGLAPRGSAVETHRLAEI